MSEDGYHIHGPHDHELEHAAHEGGRMINQIAMFTAIIATIGAIFSYMGGATQAAAALAKNNATITKTEANDQWNYYQAKGTKQALAELARDLSSAADKEKYQAKVDRYEKEKADIKAKADALEEEVKALNHESDEQMHEHHRWAQATTVLQISIALAAIALLSKKKWLEYAMFGTGALGLVVGVLAMLHV